VVMRPMVMLIFAESHLKAVRMVAMSDIEHGLKFMRLRNEFSRFRYSPWPPG
jgi:hypothetical protein